MGRDAQRPVRIASSAVEDERYKALKQGLEQLSSSQLQSILDYSPEMVYDMFNYDEATGRY
jgi:hypothetical protein